MTTTNPTTAIDDLIDRFRALPTAAVSDALDRAGLPGALQGIRPLDNGFRAVGPAFTVRYEPVSVAGATVGDFLDDVPAGAVIVIDNAGREDVTVWGGIMTGVAAARGISGTVINGVCRDIGTSLAVNYPLFSRGRFMRTGKDRVQLGAVQDMLHVGGVDIAPGDIVCADADGVVVVPRAAAERIAATAAEIERAEAAIVEAVRGGATLREAREKYGYHRLQSRQPAR